MVGRHVGDLVNSSWVKRTFLGYFSATEISRVEQGSNGSKYIEAGLRRIRPQPAQSISGKQLETDSESPPPAHPMKIEQPVHR